LAELVDRSRCSLREMAARAPSASDDGAQAAPLLRELLGVLLNVQAHVESNGAQLERVHAQLERLDARVSTLEQHRCRAAPPILARIPPPAATRERALTLLDLSTDALDKVVAHLDSDDELATALACRRLRDAVRGSRVRDAASASRPTLSTRVCSLLGSLRKLRWGVASGAPLSAALFLRVAGRGDLRMLGWLRARGCRWRSPGRAAMLARQWLPVGLGHVLGSSSRRSSGRAVVGARWRLPVEPGHVRTGSWWRPPVCAAVGACQRLPVERTHVRIRRSRRSSGLAAVGACQQLRVEQADMRDGGG
jgi:hypothetical protein